VVSIVQNFTGLGSYNIILAQQSEGRKLPTTALKDTQIEEDQFEDPEEDG